MNLRNPTAHPRDIHYMRIQRSSTRLSFRRQRRRRSGCLSITLLTGLLVGLGALSLNWVGTRLNFTPASRQDDNLMAGAEAAFARGDLDETVNQARAALLSQPDSEAALTLLVRALIYRSYSEYDRTIDRQSALQFTTETLANIPQTARLLATHAYALQAAGQPIEAARVADEALKLDPEDGLARVAYALAYGSVGSFEIALRESLSVVRNPEWALEAQRAVAISYGDLGNYDEAMKAMQVAIELNPRLTPLYFERALYALQIGDAGTATAAYFQVLTFAPNNVKARLRLCELSSLMRERDAAINYCKQVTERAPAWSAGWYQLGLEHFLGGDFPAAQNAFNRCAALQVMQNVPVNERKFECWYLQGQAAEILGDCPALLATYNEFRSMAAGAAIEQTWTYPPEGPPGCVPATTT